MAQPAGLLLGGVDQVTGLVTEPLGHHVRVAATHEPCTAALAGRGSSRASWGGDDRKRHAPPLVTRPVRLDRAAVEDAVHDVIDCERARVDDPGASIPGADPDDVHGWHYEAGLRHPREPGMPVFHPECWRFFRQLDLGWLGDDLLISFAWDELGTPNLRHLTRVGFMSFAVEHCPTTLALTARGHLRYLLAPIDIAVLSGPRDPRDTAAVAAATARTGSWRYRCGRLWLSADHVLIDPSAAPDQQRLDLGWELPWPSLTNPAKPPGPPGARRRSAPRPGARHATARSTACRSGRAGHSTAWTVRTCARSRSRPTSSTGARCPGRRARTSSARSTTSPMRVGRDGKTAPAPGWRQHWRCCRAGPLASYAPSSSPSTRRSSPAPCPPTTAAAPGGSAARRSCDLELQVIGRGRVLGNEEAGGRAAARTPSSTLTYAPASYLDSDGSADRSPAEEL